MPEVDAWGVLVGGFEVEWKGDKQMLLWYVPDRSSTFSFKSSLERASSMSIGAMIEGFVFFFLLQFFN